MERDLQENYSQAIVGHHSTISQAISNRIALKSLWRYVIPGIVPVCFLQPASSKPISDIWLSEPVQRHNYNLSAGDLHALQNATIQVTYGTIELDLVIGTPIKDIQSIINLGATMAIQHFQETYPDKERFRYNIIMQALWLETYSDSSVSVCFRDFFHI